MVVYESSVMIDNNKPISESISHIAGTFLIDAAGSFLNGAGLGSGEEAHKLEILRLLAYAREEGSMSPSN
jgi:hypothetical protein